MSLEAEAPEENSEREGIKKYFDLHKPVFWPSVFLILTMIITTLVMGEQAQRMFEVVQSFISNNMGWLFIGNVPMFV